MGIPKSANGGRGVDRLTDAECRAAKPGAKPYKLSDGRATYLLIEVNGAKYWRMKYRFPKGGKERVYAIGVYPEVSLADARIERDRARRWLKEGKDPTIERRLELARATASQAINFESVAEDWLAKQVYSAGHLTAQRKRLREELIPYLGRLPVNAITPPIALEALRRIERRGALETCSKCRVMGSQVYRYAIAAALAESDPFASLSDALRRPDTQHRATIPTAEMPALFKALAKVPAEVNTKLALYWLILTCARTGEMRYATWGEIQAGRWRVPSVRMKKRREHVVPLSRQALAILAAARPLRTSDEPSALLFPGFTRAGSLSEAALLALLARSGYYGRQTSHGFRASFSTWANEEREADPDVIEFCLAHVGEGVRAVYNRAGYLTRRLELLQAWADQCEAWGMTLP